ncbi:MAG TPA: outer membrane protein transport protein [Phycisphaerae bacterium]|nr:outer membrane protein transport protein [Phycisphaerae bacterium]HRY68081.1 outer membrane protein transport protein [Phycisphaerae bacterium]HSA29049.1 outer membrane protein transport protein [Phycisphaerae bacterium]
MLFIGREVQHIVGRFLWVNPLRLVGILWVAWAWSFPALATDGVEPIGVSMQARARGGADVAVGDSALSQIDNPASLCLSPRDLCKLDFAGKLGILDVRWRGPLDSDDSEVKLIPLVNAGIAVPLNDRLTFGVALNSKAGLGTRFSFRHLFIPFWNRREASDTKMVSMPISLGYKLTDKLSFGLGGRFEAATSEFSTVLGPADIEFGRGYAYGGGFNAGLHYKAADTLSFGLAYRSPTWFGDLSGGKGKASLLGCLPVSLGEVALEDLKGAQRIAAGAAWDATPWLKIIGEVRWLNYDQSTFHRTRIRIHSPIDLSYPFPLGYCDQWAFILGSEFKLSEHWRLGAGYHFATPNTDRYNLTPMGSITSTHHGTIGLRYETRKWWVGGGYVIAFPKSIDGPGSSHILLGTDYGDGHLAQTQHLISMGFGFSW